MWFIPFLFVSLSWGFTPTQVCEEPQDNFVQNLLDKVKPAPVFKRKGYITPEEYRNLSSRQIGELIVKHIHQECDEVRGASQGPAMEDDSDIMMFIPSGVLESAAKYGFQNQHVTRSTQGCSCREARYSAEVNFPGKMLGYGPKGKDVLPKYSALNVKNAANFNENPYDVSSAEHYGDVVLVFKPEVKKRTTWTTNDSLGVVPFRGSKATNTLKFRDKTDNPIKCGIYCEAQIWGELDMSDVAYAIIKPEADVPPALKSMGIAVYDREKAKSSVGYKKGKLRSAEVFSTAKGTVRYPSSEGWDKEKGANPVSDRVVEHKKLQQMDIPSLLNAFEASTDYEQKREIAGQLAVSSTSGAKDFFIKTFPQETDPILRSQLFLGMSQHGLDPKVRKIFQDFLKTQALTLKPGEFGFGGPSQDLLMALAVVADTPGFKEDKELQKIALEVGKKGGDDWFKRLYEDAPLCPEVDEKISGSSSGGYMGGSGSGYDSSSGSTPAPEYEGMGE